ncbi:MAG: hypothetical protein ABI358_02690 [Ginsengibacter sp.]
MFKLALSSQKRAVAFLEKADYEAFKKLNSYPPTRKKYFIKKVHKNKGKIGLNNSQGIKIKTRALGIILIIALKVNWNV